MTPLLLAIDQGTTNTKALLVARNGKPVFKASVPLSLVTPRAGWVEQDPNLIWRSVQEVVRRCLEYAGTGAICGVTLANQRETALAWVRETGEPVAPAMSWQCRRSEPLCHALSEEAERVFLRAGLTLDPLLSATKWSWLLRERPELQDQAAAGLLCFGTVDSWLLYKLTSGAVHATDHTNASRTGLLNLQTLEWDRELLAVFSLPSAALPRLADSGSNFGTVSALRELQGVPIVAVLGDSHAAMLGHANTRPGASKATYGTGSSLMTLVAELPQPVQGLARTVAWSRDGIAQYALEGNITMTGAAVQWVGEFLGLQHPAEDAVRLAEKVPDAGGLYLVPAMVGLGAPHWNSGVRGVLSGLGRHSTAAHMARAALDAIAFQVADVFHAVKAAGRDPLTSLGADGGATRNAALMQFQADVLEVPVLRSNCEDLSALGSAWLGGLTLQWWHSLADLEGLPETATRFEPGPRREAHYRGWRAAVAAALRAGGAS